MGIPLELQRNLQIKPLGIQHGMVVVAPLFPLTEAELDSVSRTEAGLPVVEQPVDRAEVLRYLRSISGASTMVTGEGGYASGFTSLLLEAVERKASDLHIRLLANGELCSVRQRVNGYLQPPFVLDPQTAKRFITWIKQKAELDSSEHIHPQEGRFSLFGDGVRLEFRVSCSGQSEGETMVIRLLDPRRILSLDALTDDGALASKLQGLVDIGAKQGGLVLVSGPTGSGKTTTLAALTGALPVDRLKVVAIEDPVEIRTEGVDHLEVDVGQDLGFAQLLRAVLRQDPDVIVIGEIRDQETAEIALRAVETGHWVMASVHAGSVLETVYRLSSLLPESYQALGNRTLQTRLHAILNQQLVPQHEGRRLLIEALFVEHPGEALIPWFDVNADAKALPGCTYFARA
jgi:type II secretory ATPase GspE/PulE/Tfp pilus assembly ATPase PilB-like protein